MIMPYNFIITKDGHTFVDFDDDRVGIGGTPDLEMSDSSENSVQNKVIKEYVDNNTDTINTIIANLTTYSLDEINTGIKWIDGKDIFKKTIYISSLPNATAAVYDTTVTNMQEFIYLYGRASGGLIVNGVRPDSRELEIGAWYDETQDKIRVATGIDRRSIAAYITILYTKSTDEVVSNE